ncbi:hypothetical protein APE_0470.1 [Aeropyrum pernix K1]|uniref:ABC transporter, permease protein n=1 Tax=Aeropyrum pernix (strain ATCC 700893 / DSM 11879 / JCM 9820 / NBRC 100138 / K1) TaxID=272557 RepID=Q9YEW3_AERPE|nr:ABC transporter permease subunit [Aeropyrum pernix]BAA79433.2 hypothetical protein APE_0470.1 [Aeropyrum pernix K1]
MGERLIILSMAIAVLVVLTVWSWKPLEEDLETLQELLAQFPEEFIKFFAKGGVYTLNFDTYYIMNFHGFFYTAVLGGYIAYSSANAISGEVQGKTFWILLSSPHRRGLVLLSKYLVAVAVAAVASASTLAALALSAGVYGFEVDLARYLALYTAGTVYLASVASLGILLGAVALSPRAPWAAAGVVIAMYFVDTLTLDTRLERLGALSLTRYHDALGIVLEGGVPGHDLAVLALSALAMLLTAVAIFERRDINI